MNWQPIETAPKDGTEVWAFNGEQARMVWLEDEFCALWVWGDALLTEVDPSPDQPTHWMTLPAAPGEESPAALNLEAAAKKLAELFDYPWEHMPAEGRQNMRKNVEAVLLAAAAKESP